MNEIYYAHYFSFIAAIEIKNYYFLLHLIIIFVISMILNIEGWIEENSENDVFMDIPF